MDLDGDGNQDILSGSYSRMEQPMAGLFQVLWGKPDGTFKKAAVLKGTDGKPLIIPVEDGKKDGWIDNICTRPTAVDWDADGDLDLVVGNFPGTFFLFTGEGKGKFLPDAKPIMAEGKPLKIDGVHSDPFVIDWDGDGDLDLLSGSGNGGVYFAENMAGKGKKPELRPFKALIAGPNGPSGTMDLLADSELKAPFRCTRIWVDDVNEDGKLDVLVGDLVKLVSPAKGLSKEEFKLKSQEWQKAFDKASAEYAAVQGDAEKSLEAGNKLNELYIKRSEFMIDDRTGFVWLYLQK